MWSREKVFNERIEPLLRAAYDIAVANDLKLVWSTCYGADGDDFLLNSSIAIEGVVGKDYPPAYYQMCRVLGIPITEEKAE